MTSSTSNGVTHCNSDVYPETCPWCTFVKKTSSKDLQHCFEEEVSVEPERPKEGLCPYQVVICKLYPNTTEKQRHELSSLFDHSILVDDQGLITSLSSLIFIISFPYISNIQPIPSFFNFMDILYVNFLALVQTVDPTKALQLVTKLDHHRKRRYHSYNTPTPFHFEEKPVKKVKKEAAATESLLCHSAYFTEVPQSTSSVEFSENNQEYAESCCSIVHNNDYEEDEASSSFQGSVMDHLPGFLINQAERLSTCSNVKRRILEHIFMQVYTKDNKRGPYFYDKYMPLFSHIKGRLSISHVPLL